MMSKIKKIELMDVFLPNIINVDDAKEETQTVVQNFYNRFMNERNYNNCEKSLRDLESYRYIHNKWIIPQGRYVRYIDTRKPYNMTLKKGGFVIECNKYMFKLLGKPNRTFYVNRKDMLFFMKLNNDDYMRSVLNSYE